MAQLTDIILQELRSNRAMAERFVDDIPDEAMARQFGDMKNHPAWQLGHIAVSLAFAGQVIGADYAPPEGWDKLFPPGTNPVGDRGAYPSKAALWAELERVCDAVALRLPQLDAAALAADFPEEKFRTYWPTVAGGVQFFAVSHFAFHLGQLSAWRRAAGLPSAMGV